ncbi:MAG: sigma-70 family RNA polymerase sigma factor [Gammaproteobacteria bacterium]|nr:sigma-70 family RNA polymerase sigma factor [Gammaproteobacteria bacterium]MCP5199812.1 sigma-70 family RNA polymerase sigma factor [Gammaproteobacteria bacterium]
MSTPAEQPWHEDEQRWSAWMARAQAGDGAVYERLLGELGNAIEAYIRVRFGALDLIEDCVQECLLAVHRARHTYDPARPFRPWLFTLVRHQTIDVLRRGRRQEGRPPSAPVDDVEAVQRRLDGVKVLEGLAPDHREAVALTQYAGFTAAEAADWLNISESALKARLRRGLAAIRKMLDGEGLPP